MKEVQRDHVGAEVADGHRQVHAVLIGFADSEESAAAKFHSGFQGGAGRPRAVVPGVGRTDLGEMSSRGLQVMVVADETGFDEAPGAGRGQGSETGADRQAGALADPTCRFTEGVEFPIRDLRAAGNESEVADRVGRRRLGLPHQLVGRREASRFDPGGPAGALGAPATVFAAATQFDRRDAA